MIPTLDELNQLKEQKLVNCQRHPEASLTIWNYTNKCQFGRDWNGVTTAARGLILDDAGKVVSRSFKKFWNYGERPEDAIPDCPFKVMDKLDGSLGVLFLVNGEPAIATRGSFTGEQAVVGTRIFRERYANYKPPEGFTAVFEIVYPADRKVVDYGNTEDLFHLGLVDNATGLVQFDLDHNWPGPCVQTLDNHLVPGKLERLLEDEVPNCEGYVVRWQNGFQLKIKLKEYLRVFKIMYQTSTKSIWEVLSAGRDLDYLLTDAPDEVQPFIKQHGTDLLRQFSEVESQALFMFGNISTIAKNRKDFATHAMRTGFAPVLFALLDGKNYSKIIWKMLEPDWIPAKAISGEDVA